MTDERRAELAANLAALSTRVAAACASAGRPRTAVTVIAVTKTFPLADVQILAALGVRDVAENRDQEARAKAAESPPGLRWHFVGQLQRNKVRSVTSYADVVHSVDRLDLVPTLGRAAATRVDPLDVLIQVNMADGADPVGARGGAAPGEVPRLAAAIAAEPALRLRGVMTVAPREGDPSAAFERLRQLSAALERDHPGAAWISAGMSGDFESAIRHGATHVRVGSVLLGSRSRFKGTVAG